MLNVFSSMNFFKYWFRQKMIKTWIQNVRYQSYVKNRRTLAHRLFIAKPLFAPILAKVHSITRELENVRTLSIGTNVYHLEEFAEGQQTQRAAAIKQIEQYHDMITGCLDKLVHTVLKSCVNLKKKQTTAKHFSPQPRQAFSSCAAYCAGCSSDRRPRRTPREILGMDRRIGSPVSVFRHD